VKYLLDTHVFLWAITDAPQLSPAHRAVYLGPANSLYLSTASVWEMLIKSGLGKLFLPAPAMEFLIRQMEKNRIQALPIRLSHLAQLETPPPLHTDPFDRMIVAQSRAESMPILSSDPQLRKYPVTVI